MNLKECVIFALRQSRKDGHERVVGKEKGKWKTLLMDDISSDNLENGIIITQTGFKYPEEERRFQHLRALGE